MMWAAYNNQVAAIKKLIEYKADPALMDDDGMTALCFALQAEAQDTIQFLLPEDKASLGSAAERGYVEYVTALLEWEVSPDQPDEEGNTALLRCAMSTQHFDDDDWVEVENTEQIPAVLFEWGATLEAVDPQFQQTALGWAIKTNKPKLSETLRNAGADIEGHAAQHFRVRGQSLLISCIADMQDSDENAFDVWPIPKSQMKNKYLAPMVDQVIRMGANVEACDSSGRTALMYAATLGDVGTVQVLAAHADTHATDYEGQTALVYATLGGHEQVVQVLLDYGADPHVKDRAGNALWVAAELEGHFGTANLLQTYANVQ